MFVEMTKSNKCSMCSKGSATCFCTGCKAYFCRKHFNEHHTKLVHELDGYVEERNTLQGQINKIDSCDAILLQIDEWQQTMVERVIQAAEQVRQKINVSSAKRAEITIRFKEFSHKLGYLKETEDFVEDDLTEVKDMTDKIKQDLEKLIELPSFELHIEENEKIAWDRLIYLKEKPASIENKQNQQQTTGELINKFICVSIHISALNYDIMR
jgi:chromosome segregation ATPase